MSQLSRSLSLRYQQSLGKPCRRRAPCCQKLFLSIETSSGTQPGLDLDEASWMPLVLPTRLQSITTISSVSYMR